MAEITLIMLMPVHFTIFFLDNGKLYLLVALVIGVLSFKALTMERTPSASFIKKFY